MEAPQGSGAPAPGGAPQPPQAPRYVLTSPQELQFRAQTVAIHLLRNGQAPDDLMLAAANGKCEYKDGAVVQVREPGTGLPSTCLLLFPVLCKRRCAARHAGCHRHAWATRVCTPQAREAASWGSVPSLWYSDVTLTCSVPSCSFAHAGRPGRRRHLS